MTTGPFVVPRGAPIRSSRSGDGRRRGRLGAMRTRAYGAALVAVLVALLLGCGAEQDAAKEPDPQEETVSNSPSEQPSSSAEPNQPTSTGASDPVSLAAADLAEQLGIPREQVEVVAREAVTWRDGSLGCAEKGTSYTQALVEGGRITLRADGTTYEYHHGGRRAPFWCERPTQ